MSRIFGILYGGIRIPEIMKRIGFKMKLFSGCEEEYKKRHEALWPELKVLLQDTGVVDYSIWLDRDTFTLFGSLKLKEPHTFDQLPGHPVMKRWWSYMKDIMETHPDHSPVTFPLEEVFYLE
jgi:L-rhamnose mutarotase